jgi:hypothetical protein
MEDPLTDWQPGAELLAHLDEAIPAILESQKEDGCFGSEPWISTDQNVLLALAAAFALPASQYHGSEDVLEAIGQGGIALAQAQDENGMWEFRKKDGSEWGPIRMPWVYSRWMRAFYHVGDQLPESVRQQWLAGLELGFSGIFEELQIVEQEQMSTQQVAEARREAAASQAYRFVRIHNISAHHAMGLAFAGKVFERPVWTERAAAYLRAVAEAQSEFGWWEEHGGPVVAYNFVYAEALGIYLSLTGDEAVRPALERAAQYHAEFTYPDGSAVETVDGRNPYMTGIKLGNNGFALTPAGRGWLARQHRLFLQQGGVFDADYAATMLLYGGQGPVSPPAGERESHVYHMGDMASTKRRKPWFVCCSAIATELSAGRFGQDRQNFLSLYHDRAGLIVGGGNTKLQPLWSSFTVGDTALLEHVPGDEDPDFSVRPGLLHVPDRAQLDSSGEDIRLQLDYGATECSIVLVQEGEDEMRIELAQRTDERAKATNSAGPVQAHLTLMPRIGQPLRAHDGSELALGASEIIIDAVEGGWIEHGNWRLTLPSGSRCCWPVLPHNPYRKDGLATIEEARLVVSIPLPDESSRSLKLAVT